VYNPAPFRVNLLVILFLLCRNPIWTPLLLL